MSKRILSVGQCGPDHCMLSRYIKTHFDAEVVGAEQLSDTIQKLRESKYDLVLINRKLDADYSDGMEILKAIKSDADFSTIPVMMVTNYPEHQKVAVEAGAVYGFGKLEYCKPETLERLQSVLS